ncbi:hypothetical protein GCM10009837_30510 [Streptomyces durmitorensis]
MPRGPAPTTATATSCSGAVAADGADKGVTPGHRRGRWKRTVRLIMPPEAPKSNPGTEDHQTGVACVTWLDPDAGRLCAAMGIKGVMRELRGYESRDS